MACAFIVAMTERRTDNQYHEYARHIGDKVRKGRTLRQITQRNLATTIGVTSTQLYKYETGENRLCVVRLCLIAEALELPIHWFIQETMPNAVGGIGANLHPPLSLCIDTLTAEIQNLPPEQAKRLLKSMIGGLQNL